jgi:hypothetical protein
MLKYKALMAMAMSVGVGVLVQAQAQPRNTAASSLSAMDYVEIRQLAARYTFALDTGAEDGLAYADLFSPDGESVRPNAKGREQLAALARGGRRGPSYVTHFGMNHVIEPSPQGATGRQYVVEISFDENGRGQNAEQNAEQNAGQNGAQNGRGQNAQAAGQWDLVGRRGGELSTSGGHYEDAYVKTSNGWRFKRREFVPSASGPQLARLSGNSPAAGQTPRNDATAAAKPSTNGPSTLAAQDYLEIEKLVASYGHALDSGFGEGDNGEAYAGLFAPHGIFYSRGRPYAGPEALAALARAQPHGSQYIRHFLTDHVIEPVPGGAKGKEHLVVIDIGENGKASSIFLGGYYEDVYVKTPKGWRFQTRRSFGSSSGTQPSSQPARGTVTNGPSQR